MDDGKVHTLIILESFRTPITEEFKPLLAALMAPCSMIQEVMLVLDVVLREKIRILQFLHNINTWFIT